MSQSSAEKGLEKNPALFASRVPELDGIRGVAILMVVCCHYFAISKNAGWVGKSAETVISMGWSGVDLFFVLSGFLIGGILIDNCDSENYFKTFYVRRVCRILPLYFSWLALYFVLGAFLPKTFPGYGQALGWEIFHFPKWGYLLFLQNFYSAVSGDLGALWMGATWSLAMEEQFYLLAPVLMRIVVPRKPLPVLIFLIALVPAVRVFLYLFDPGLFIHVLLPCRADTLLLGILCAYLVRQKRVYAWLAENTRVLYALFFCLLVGMGYIASLGYGYDPRRVLESFEMASFGYTWVALFYVSVLLIVVVKKTSVMARVCRHSLLRHFGMISYGVYIMHLGVDAFVQGLFFGPAAANAPALSRTLAALPAFLITWLLAVLSWRLFERPIVQWGHTFQYKKRQKAEQRRATVLPQPL